MYNHDHYGMKISRKTNEDEIISITELPHPGDVYVYDLETENHHFAVGPGALVVHNTDSSMIDMHVPIKEVYQRGLDLAQEITYGLPERKLEDGTIIPATPALFPPPLKIEFEKAMKMCCIKKKKYMAFYIDKNGEYMREKNKDGTLGDYKVLKRGIIVARRDTAKIVHKTYNKLLMMVLKEEPIVKSFNLIIDVLDDLLNNRLDPRKDLSIIRQYSGSYKAENFMMKVFGDELIRQGKPVNPSDRLEYVIVKTDAEKNMDKKERDALNLGMKFRLIEMYEESQRSVGYTSETHEETQHDIALHEGLIFDHPDDPLKIPDESSAVYPPEDIDYEYYIGHVLMNPIDQLFSIGYMKQLEKIKHIGYTPKNKASKPISISEPIKMIAKMIEDYQKQGATLEQIKPIIPQMKTYFENFLAEA